MSATTELNIWVKLKDDASKAIEGLNGKIKSMEPTFQKMAVVGGAMLGTVTAIGIKAIKDYGDAEKSAKQLEHATLNVAHATRAHLDALNETADALQKKGVLDGDAIKMGQAQLMTFGLSADFVQKLSGSMADLAVNQFGVNAGGEQLTQTANIMAKALNGQFGVLEKSGIRFTDAQKKMIQFGNETERATALQEGLAQNLKYTNEVALGTFEGKMAKVNTLLGDVSESIGAILMPAVASLLDRLAPLLQKIVEWAGENPKLIATIMGVVAGIGALLLVVGSLGLLLPSIIAGFTALGTAITGVMTFMTGGLNLAIMAVIVGLVALWTKSEDFRNAVIGLGQTIIGFLQPIFQGMLEWFGSWRENLSDLWLKLGAFRDQIMSNVVVIAILDNIKLAFSNIWVVVQQHLWPALVNLWTTLKTQLWPALLELWEAITPLIPLFEMFLKVVGALVVGGIIVLTHALSAVIIVIAKALEWITELTTFITKVATFGIKALAQEVSWLTGAFESLVGWIGKAIDKFNQWKNSGASLNPFSDSFALPFIGRANGGPVNAGQSYIVGEKGPEIFTPGIGGSIGAIGGGGITVVIQGNSFIGERDLARKVGNELVDLLKLNKRV